MNGFNSADTLEAQLFIEASNQEWKELLAAAEAATYGNGQRRKMQQVLLRQQLATIANDAEWERLMLEAEEIGSRY